MIVLARDLLCIDTMEGLVDRGGEGRKDLGVSIEVGELIIIDVGAMAGDCNGDCIGDSFPKKSIMIGGSSGVVA